MMWLNRLKLYVDGSCGVAAIELLEKLCVIRNQMRHHHHQNPAEQAASGRFFVQRDSSKWDVSISIFMRTHTPS